MATILDATHQPDPGPAPLAGLDELDLQYRIRAALTDYQAITECECCSHRGDVDLVWRAVLDVLDDAGVVLMRRHPQGRAEPARRCTRRGTLVVGAQEAAQGLVRVWWWGRALDELRAGCQACRLLLCADHAARIVLDGAPAEVVADPWCTRPAGHGDRAAVATIAHPAVGTAAVCAECLADLIELEPDAPAAVFQPGPVPLPVLIERTLADTIDRPDARQVLDRHRTREGRRPPIEVIAAELAAVAAELLASLDIDPAWYGESPQIVAGATVAAFWRVATINPLVVDTPGDWHDDLTGAAAAQLAFPLVFTGR